MRQGIIAFLLLAAVGAAGQGLSGYSDLEVKHADEASFLLDGGGPEYLKGDVQIELLPDSPNLPALPIRCGEMLFEYAEGQLNSIRLEGSVDVTHPEGRVRAGRAVWNFSTNVLSFYGNPVIDTELAQNMAGGTITIDLSEGHLKFTGGFKSPRISLTNVQDPSKLGADDITDWEALLTQLQQQANGEGASPGKHLVGLLGANLQSTLKTQSPAILAGEQNRSLLLGQLNGLLKRDDFYDVAAWQGVEIPAETQGALGNYPPAEAALKQVNRDLLEAAFPAAF